MHGLGFLLLCLFGGLFGSPFIGDVFLILLAAILSLTTFFTALGFDAFYALCVSGVVAPGVNGAIDVMLKVETSFVANPAADWAIEVVSELGLSRLG